MDGFYLAILAIVGLPTLWGAAVWAEAYSFKRKLYRLGHLAGRTKDEIMLTIGLPNSFLAVDGSKELLQWQRPGYHIALLFANGICEGATHECNAY